MNKHILSEIFRLSVFFKTASIYYTVWARFEKVENKLGSFSSSQIFFISKKQEVMRDSSRNGFRNVQIYFFLEIFFTLPQKHCYDSCLFVLFCFKRDLLLSCLELRNQEICHHQIIILAPKMMTLLRYELRSRDHVLTCFSRMVLLQLL